MKRLLIVNIQGGFPETAFLDFEHDKEQIRDETRSNAPPRIIGCWSC